MLRQYVVSSDLRSVGWSCGTLEIEFISGGTYQYRNVPESIYTGLMNADSKGKFFHKYIRNVYVPAYKIN